MSTITRVYRADWAPHIEQAVRAIATAAAFIYTCGYVAGRELHRLNDTLTALLVSQPTPAPARVIVQRQAAVATAPANIAPPRVGIIHISDPMARAVRLVRDGKSQRLAASICNVSRSSLQRALKA